MSSKQREFAVYEPDICDSDSSLDLDATDNLTVDYKVPDLETKLNDADWQNLERICLCFDRNGGPRVFNPLDFEDAASELHIANKSRLENVLLSLECAPWMDNLNEYKNEYVAALNFQLRMEYICSQWKVFEDRLIARSFAKLKCRATSSAKQLTVLYLYEKYSILRPYTLKLKARQVKSSCQGKLSDEYKKKTALKLFLNMRNKSLDRTANLEKKSNSVVRKRTFKRFSRAPLFVRTADKAQENKDSELCRRTLHSWNLGSKSCMYNRKREHAGMSTLLQSLQLKANRLEINAHSTVDLYTQRNTLQRLQSTCSYYTTHRRKADRHHNQTLQRHMLEKLRSRIDLLPRLDNVIFLRNKSLIRSTLQTWKLVGQMEAKAQRFAEARTLSQAFTLLSLDTKATAVVAMRQVRDVGFCLRGGLAHSKLVLYQHYKRHSDIREVLQVLEVLSNWAKFRLQEAERLLLNAKRARLQRMGLHNLHRGLVQVQSLERKASGIAQRSAARKALRCVALSKARIRVLQDTAVKVRRQTMARTAFTSFQNAYISARKRSLTALEGTVRQKLRNRLVRRILLAMRGRVESDRKFNRALDLQTKERALQRARRGLRSREKLVAEAESKLRAHTISCALSALGAACSRLQYLEQLAEYRQAISGLLQGGRLLRSWSVNLRRHRNRELEAEEYHTRSVSKLTRYVLRVWLEKASQPLPLEESTMYYTPTRASRQLPVTTVERWKNLHGLGSTPPRLRRDLFEARRHGSLRRLDANETL